MNKPKLTKTISLRVTERFNDALRDKAAELSLTGSQVIRQAILRALQSPTSVPPNPSL